MYSALETIRKHWCWFLTFGILLTIIGVVAIGSAVYTTFFTIFFLAVLLMVAGAIKIFYAFWARKWGGFFLQLIAGALYLLTGILAFLNPIPAATAITLLMAIVFIIEGLVKISGSLMQRFQGWGWVLFSGLISLILGGLIISEWPYSGLWIIGLFVGIDLIVYGWTWIMLSLSAKRLPDAP